MSASESIAAPHRPTSPNDIGSSESSPSSVGMSNAVDNPSPPERMISLKRQLVSSAVPNPANIRIVHSRDRYIEAYGPRVYGWMPGNSPSSGPYTGSSGIPDIVEKRPGRTEDAPKASSQRARLVVTQRWYRPTIVWNEPAPRWPHGTEPPRSTTSNPSRDAPGSGTVP